MNILNSTSISPKTAKMVKVSLVVVGVVVGVTVAAIIVKKTGMLNAAALEVVETAVS